MAEAPVFGTSTSSYTETVRPFYNFWINFSSRRSFAWKDVYNTTQAPNRDVRRAMEKENKKERDKAKREFNELVRRLAEFVRKKDPRVLEWAKSQATLKAEKEAQEKEQKIRQAAEVRARQEAARLAQQEQLDSIDLSGMDLQELMSEKDLKRHKHMFQNEGEEDEEEDVVEEFYCPACKKVFKSDKQFKNHENSKKHKDMAAKLRKELLAEDEAAEAAMAKTAKGKGKQSAAASPASKSVNGGKKNGNKFEPEEDIFVDDDDDFIHDLETIRHADDDLIHNVQDMDAEEDAEDSDGDETILADLSQYRLHDPAADAKKPDSEAPKKTENNKKVVVAQDEEDEDEEDEGDDDGMLNMMAAARMSKSRFAIESDEDDEEEAVEEQEIDEAPATAKGASEKKFNFNDFMSTLPDTERASPSGNAKSTGAAVIENDAKQKKRRRAAKDKEKSAAAVAPEPEPEYERGGKRGGKGKKGGRNTQAPAENSCRTCGSSFPSKTALHNHLKETKHAIAT